MPLRIVSEINDLVFHDLRKRGENFIKVETTKKALLLPPSIRGPITVVSMQKVKKCPFYRGRNNVIVAAEMGVNWHPPKPVELYDAIKPFIEDEDLLRHFYDLLMHPRVMEEEVHRVKILVKAFKRKLQWADYFPHEKAQKEERVNLHEVCLRQAYTHRRQTAEEFFNILPMSIPQLLEQPTANI